MSEKTSGILLVIPCLNEEHYLEKLVLGLLESCRSMQARIVIADGGSTDKTTQIGRKLAARYPEVLVIDNPKRLQSAGINLAVASFGDDADFFIRIDAHAGYPADYCKVLVEEARVSKAASVVVAMNTMGKTWFQRAVAAAQNSRLGNGGASHRMAGGTGVWTDHGHHALMRVDAFRKVGGYDESFSHNEDGELDLRLRQAGFAIWLTARTTLTYYPRASPAALFSQYVRYGEGRARTILKHRALPKLRQLAPAGVVPAMLLALLAPLSWLFALPLMVWFVLCIGVGIAMGMKTRSTSVAASGIAALLMHSGWSLGFCKVMIKKLLGGT